MEETNKKLDEIIKLLKENQSNIYIPNVSAYPQFPTPGGAGFIAPCTCNTFSTAQCPYHGLGAGRYLVTFSNT